MKRLVYLLAICLSFAALADIPMWQRNNGAWEAVVRVSKEDPVWEIGDFHAVTNGYVTMTFPHTEATNVLYRIDYDFLNGHSGNATVSLRKSYSHSEYAVKHVYPIPDPLAWTNDPNTVTWKTNDWRRKEIADGEHIRWDIKAIVPVRTNVIDTTPSPITSSGDLPCRFGVPQTITVSPPYTDLLEMLPLNGPTTYTRIRTGFDGYLLIRFDEREMRLTIKRLLPEKLPYEHPRRNIRVLRDDVLNGV